MPAVPDVPDDSNLLLARTPLAHWHTQHGVRFDEINSWQVPAVYTDENSEVAAARTGLAITDISFTSKVMLRGPGVQELTQSLTGDSPAAKPGGVAPLTADRSVLACRLHIDQLLVLGSSTGNDKLEQILSEAASHEGQPPGLTRWSVWLFGPHTDELLRQLTHFDVAALSGGREPAEQGSCAQTGLAGVPAILVRPPNPAILSMRILTGWDLAEYVWENLFREGQIWNISPLGLDGLDMLLSENPK